MIRVEVKNGDDPLAPQKLLKFDASIDFECLLRKIAKKVGAEDCGSVSPSEFFELSLGGHAVVEATSDLDYGDKLVLKKKQRRENTGSAGEISGDNADKVTQNSDSSSGIQESEGGESREKKRIKTEDIIDCSGKDQPAKVKAEANSDVEMVSADKNVSSDSPSRSVKQEDAGLASCPGGASDASIKTASGGGKGESQEDAIELSSDEEIGDEDCNSSVEEGSDGWEAESEDEDEDKDLSDDKPLRSSSAPAAAIKEEKKPRSRKAWKEKESPLKVIMDEKDVPMAPGKRLGADDDPTYQTEFEEVSTLVDKSGRRKAEQDVKDRIIKLLNTGFHSESNENEAKNAMKLAQRLMRKHNLSQALLLKERNDKTKEGDGEVLKGGMVNVDLVNRKTGKPSLLAQWLDSLSNAVAENFGVETYYNVWRGRRCQITFYGIYTNAQLAAYAFRVSAERIAQMAADYKPQKSWRNISTRSSRLSYAIGMVTGIEREVEASLRREKEQRERKLERARQAITKGEAYVESDDEDDNEGPGFVMSVDTDDAEAHESSSKDTPGSPGSPKEDEDEANKATLSGAQLEKRAEELQQESQCALALVDHSKKVAEKVLEDEGIKVHTARKRKAIQFDHGAHRQGVEDSKEIDINQRAIRHEVKVKREK
ncbi:MAG: hypothetical protein SGILL_006910 [Bacillariaceae sp.]